VGPSCGPRRRHLDQVHAEICRWTAILELPAWAMTMLRQRERMVSIRRSWPASRSFLHPSQAGYATRPTPLKMMRQAFKHAGFQGVTRATTSAKTVATLMDEAGLSARSAADQLGHAKPSLTADIYTATRSVRPGLPRCSKITSNPDWPPSRTGDLPHGPRLETAGHGSSGARRGHRWMLLWPSR
jgi:hypothetical protein